MRNRIIEILEKYDDWTDLDIIANAILALPIDVEALDEIYENCDEEVKQGCQFYLYGFGHGKDYKLPIEVPSNEDLAVEIIVEFLANPHPKQKANYEREKKAFAKGAKWAIEQTIKRNKEE